MNRKILFRGVVLFLFISALAGCRARHTEILVFCAAGVRKPVEQILNAYEKNHKHTRVFVDYAGSGRQIAQISIQKKGDIMILGNAKFLKPLNQKNFVQKSAVLAYHQPVIGIQAGNPERIKRLTDFIRPDISIALGDKKVMALGYVEQRAFKKLGIWQKIRKKAKVFSVSAPQTIGYLKIGAVDAAVIWQDNIKFQPKLDFVRDEVLDKLAQPIPIILLKTSDNIAAATKTFEYIKKHRKIFEKYGFILKND